METSSSSTSTAGASAREDVESEDVQGLLHTRRKHKKSYLNNSNQFYLYFGARLPTLDRLPHFPGTYLFVRRRFVSFFLTDIYLSWFSSSSSPRPNLRFFFTPNLSHRPTLSFSLIHKSILFTVLFPARISIDRAIIFRIVKDMHLQIYIC